MKVSRVLGCGFLENVYENALFHGLKQQNLNVAQQVRLDVRYDNIVVGEYVADLIVDQKVIVELKAVASLTDIHAAQCINYLNTTRLPVCLLFNFAKPKLEFRRFIL